MFVRSRPSRTRAEHPPFLANRVLDAFDRALIGARGVALALVAAYLSRAGVVEADEFGRLESSPCRPLKRILPRAMYLGLGPGSFLIAPIVEGLRGASLRAERPDRAADI